MLIIISKIKYIIWNKKKKKKLISIEKKFKDKKELIRIKIICPALMFAASRNASVIGRTIILVVSIIIRKGFSQLGAPDGRRWAIVWDFLFINEDKISLSHRGILKVKEKIRWLENLNM